jgi:hypothetical protein
LSSFYYLCFFVLRNFVLLAFYCCFLYSPYNLHTCIYLLICVNYISVLPSIARTMVAESANSILDPTGMP